MRIVMDTKDLSRCMIWNSASDACDIERTPCIVYGNKNESYCDMPYYTWAVFALCLQMAKMDSIKGHMVSRVAFSDILEFLSNIGKVNWASLNALIEKWTHEGHNSFFNYFVISGDKNEKISLVTAIDQEDCTLDISYNEKLTEEIKQLIACYRYDIDYYMDIDILETGTSKRIYHLLYSEYKRLQAFMGKHEYYVIELTEEDFKKRGIRNSEIEFFLDESQDEISELSHLWYVYDAVISQKPNGKKTNLCYRFIFGMNEMMDL